MRDKLLEAARIGAQEATATERGRCLWCADEVVRELEAKMAKKILRSATEEQLAKVKVQIARGVVSELRRAIISGVRPAAAAGGGRNGSEPGAADPSPSEA